MACALVLDDRPNCLESMLSPATWCESCKINLVAPSQSRCDVCLRLDSDGHDSNCTTTTAQNDSGDG